jgi:diguanylate cyclase (GGDEF)-like protein/PAS domain S-box-containing protein
MGCLSLNLASMESDMPSGEAGSTQDVPADDGQHILTRSSAKSMFQLWNPVFDAISEAVVVLSADRTVLYWNQAAERITGWKAVEAVGRDTRDLTSVESLWSNADAIMAMAKAGQPWSGEFSLRRQDGVIVPVLLTAAPWLDDEGGPLGLIAIGRELKGHPVSEAESAQALEGLDPMLDLVGDVISLHAPDGTFLMVTQACIPLLGYAPDELIGTRAREYFHPDDIALVETVSLRPVLAGTGTRTVTYRFRRKDSSYEWLETTTRGLRDRDSGEVVQLICISRDVSERREAEENAPVGIAIVGLDGRYLQVSRSLCSFLGRSERELLKLSVSDVTHPDDMDRTDVAFRAMRADGGGVPAEEKRYLRPDGSRVWGLVSRWMVPDSLGGCSHFISHVTDITDRKRDEAELAHRALHDTLTGLANRALLSDRLAHALVQQSRDGMRHALLFIDLDGFKLVNDGFGHSAGDDVLREAARRIVHEVRKGDTVARLGGDEFAVVLHGVAGRADALQKAQQLCEALAVPYLVGEHSEAFVTASIGVALSAEGLTAADLLRAADSAMYLARQRGPGGAELSSRHLTERTVARLAIASGVRHAIERNELRLYYQPVIDLASGRAVGVEALMRWQQPGRGLVAPNEFIPVAEETGMIVPMGAWAIGQACRDASAFRIDGQQLTVAVNVSPRQIREGGLVSVMAGELLAGDVRADTMCIEITESSLTGDTSATIATLHELKDLGVSVALDDFGTGYSSLSYLKRLPVTVMKIDRAFVTGLAVDADDVALVRAMVSMAHALGLSVVAEGVETAEQLKILRGLGCEMAQGYLFARPQALEPALETIRALNAPAEIALVRPAAGH